MYASKLLPLTCAIALLMVLFIGIRSYQQDRGDAAALSQIPKAPAPDADSPADTIRTLTAEVGEIKSQNEALKRQNQELLKQRDDIANQVTGRMRKEMEDKDSAFNRLAEQIEGLKSRVEDIGSQAVQTGSDIPLGLGIGPDGTVGSRDAISAVTWIEPLDKDSVSEDRIKSGGGVVRVSGAQDSGSLLHPVNGSSAPVGTGVSSPEPRKPEPAYTVPRNATLIGSTGVTALIGRIPFDGKVEDPFPFKVLVGRDNLAANGLEIPGVFGMVFSGEAFGDWALACVRGKIQSVTYLFDDGTIRTLSSDDNSLNRLASQDSQRGSGNRQTAPLGWLSDRRGIPCVSGERISNAGSFLAGRILARAAEAAAGAFGHNQTTRQVSPLTGVVTSTVTGDAAKFAGFNALAGGAAEISDYLKERAAQSFDAVYVDTGTEVAVHVDREIPIDYDPSGRRLTYAGSTNAAVSTTLD